MKIKDFVSKNIKWAILFFCVIGFLLLAEDVFNKEIMQGDVLAGFLISISYLICYITIAKKIWLESDK